jgi:hypothetical protein
MNVNDLRKHITRSRRLMRETRGGFLRDSELAGSGAFFGK